MIDINEIFSGDYAVTSADRAPFGQHWVGPEQFKYGEEIKIAKYRKKGGDGHAVTVYCTAMPARFYTLDVDGKYRLSTGARGPEITLMVAVMADAISEGMLGLEMSPSA